MLDPNGFTLFAADDPNGLAPNPACGFEPPKGEPANALLPVFWPNALGLVFCVVCDEEPNGLEPNDDEFVRIDASFEDIPDEEQNGFEGF